MTRVAIVGSGPAAAAASLALLRAGGCEIEILDIGEQLETDRQDLLTRVADRRPDEWDPSVRDALSQQPKAATKGELPQKWVYGSNFPFRDLGQRESVDAVAGGNALSVSGAFGGFSNAWGAQVMPFSRTTLDQWSIGYDALTPHYRAILEQIPFAGVEDDYGEAFPLLADAHPLPRLAPPAAAVLDRYSARRRGIKRRGVTVGTARLAMDARRCIECGLCLTGCPYGLIYAASQTLEPLIRQGKVKYRPGSLVLRVGEDELGAWIETKGLDTQIVEVMRADKVLLAAGGLGSTQIVLNSIRRSARRVSLQESAQFVMPLMSVRRYQDPRTYSTFTLNQFNMLIEYGQPDLDFAQVHMYPYNPAFEDAIPGPARRHELTRGWVLRRTVAGLGYLPSWASPTIEVEVDASGGGPVLPRLHLSSSGDRLARRILRRVVSRMLSVAPALDLWPVVPAVRLSGPAKSYHFGGSFPHTSSTTPGDFQTDNLGRPREWSRVHLLDASVFPSIAATTFTLTVMANAHRIATEVGRGA